MMASLALPCVVVVMSGCGAGENRPPVHPVKGQLFVNKKPAHKAVVWLHPENDLPADGKGPAAPRPHARVAEDGSFDVSTYNPGDGAPAGRYRVTVFWTKDTGAGDSDGPSLLPPRYGDPKTAGLPVVEVKAGPNVLPPLHLRP
jgi:hypothetical protein